MTEIKGAGREVESGENHLGPHPWIPPIHLIIRLVTNSSSETTRQSKKKFHIKFMLSVLKVSLLNHYIIDIDRLYIVKSSEVVFFVIFPHGGRRASFFFLGQGRIVAFFNQALPNLLCKNHDVWKRFFEIKPVELRQSKCGPVAARNEN
jgi:hypothetical protein